MIKNIFDKILALLGLIFCLPVFLTIAFWIKINDKGPILYKSARAGLNDKSFKMLKFRTMVRNAEKIGGPSTSDDDPRITRVGHFLRKYKLDELPQLLNVLKGEMSIVGPRPEVLGEVEEFKEQYEKILTVRPGITDYASLRFPNEGEIVKGAADPHIAYKEKIQPEKIRLQMYYAAHHSFLKDVVIIAKTCKALIKKLSF